MQIIIQYYVLYVAEAAVAICCYRHKPNSILTNILPCHSETSATNKAEEWIRSYVLAEKIYTSVYFIVDESLKRCCTAQLHRWQSRNNF